MDRLINLTGHDIHIKLGNGKLLTIPQSGQVRARYTTNKLPELETEYGSIPITQNHYYRPRTLPRPRKGVFYIVSRLIAELYPERDDLLMVNGLIKENAKTIACRSLSRI